MSVPRPVELLLRPLRACARAGRSTIMATIMAVGALARGVGRGLAGLGRGVVRGLTGTGRGVAGATRRVGAGFRRAGVGVGRGVAALGHSVADSFRHAGSSTIGGLVWLGQTARRRAGWTLAVVGIVLVGLAGTGALAAKTLKSPGVFWSDVHVTFLFPNSTANPNSLQITASSVVLTAGAVAEMVNDRDPAQPADPTVTLYDEGIRQGWQVVLPNSGGQYVNFYISPFLDVQAVGPTAAYVTTTMARLIGEIKADLATLQERVATNAFTLITAKVLPDSTPLFFVRGASHIRALAATLVLGVAVTGTVLRLALWWRRRRRRRPAGGMIMPALSGT